MKKSFIKNSAMKTILLLICVTLLTGVFSGCVVTTTKESNSKNEITEEKKDDTTPKDIPKDPVTPAGQLPIVKDKITISAFILKEANVDDLVNNDATKWLEEQTNIHLDLVIAPPDGWAEKQSLVLASGTYPDIFMYGSFSNLDIMKYGVNEKVFIPLNSFIDKYGFWLNETFELIPTLKQDLIAPDGNIYGLPQINQAYHVSIIPKMWVNTDWIQQLGLKKPTTTDEFRDMLTAFKNKIEGSIPLTGAIKTWRCEPQGFLMNSFVYYDARNYFYYENGKNSFVANTNEYRDGLKYMNQLFKEGLIDPAAFTQDQAQLTQICNNPDKMVVGAYAAGAYGNGVRAGSELAKSYDAMLPLKGPKGVQYATWNDVKRIQSVCFTITDKCKNPEAAFRLADFMQDERTTSNLVFGVEGKHWWYLDKNTEEKGLDMQPARIFVNYDISGKPGSYRWAQVGPTRRTQKYRADIAVGQDIYSTVGYELRLQQVTKTYEPYKPKEVFPPLFIDSSVSDEISLLKTNINEYVSQSTVRFITGDLNIDSDWDSYVKGIDNLNLAKYLEINQNVIDKNLKAKK